MQALVKLLQIRRQEKKYAVFLGHADNTRQDRYLTQLRIVTGFALQSMFRALTPDEMNHFQIRISLSVISCGHQVAVARFARGAV